MKNDISHHGILLNLIRKPRLWIRKTRYPIQKFICVKTFLVQGKYYPKVQPNWSNNTPKSGFFRISGKTGSRIRNFFGLKPPCDQDGANKKSLSKSVQPFRSYEGSYIHTYRQRSYYFRVRIKKNCSTNII